MAIGGESGKSRRLEPSTVVLGVGNLLMGDDAVGIRVIDILRESAGLPPGVALLDGGTLGLALLPAIEGADRLVVVDAALTGGPPGAVRVLEGETMDVFLANRSRSAHDIGLDDLMAALRFRGRLPGRRALVAIEPLSLHLSQSLSEPAAAAVEPAAEAVIGVLGRWRET